MRRGVFLVGVVAAALVGPSVALAAPACPASFATEINSAGSGSTVTAPSGTCTDNITVTNTNQFKIKAAPSGSTLEPTTANTPIIQSSADVRFTISGISFTGMNGASAISLSGSGEAVTLSGNTFTNNATTTGGAAVNIDVGASTTTQSTVLEGNQFGAIGAGNTAGYGGAVYLSGSAAFRVTNNKFVGNSSPLGLDRPGGALVIATFESSATSPVVVSGNTFGGTATGAGNTTGSSGGAAFIELAGDQKLTLDHNQFIDNAITGNAVAEVDRVGGALTVTIENGGTGFKVFQAHNRFVGNVINATEASGSSGLAAGGAGEWLFGVRDHSTDDVFRGNKVTVNDGAPPEGGGLGVLGQSKKGSTPPQPGVFVGTNDLFLGNSVAAGGWGGAIYSGFLEPNCTSACPGSSVTLRDSTLVGNLIDPGPGSEGGAIWGSPTDRLRVTNSIIHGNTPTPEVFGFASHAFASSDICGFSGAGDICANPRLSSKGAETPSSPTLDAGSNALMPAGLTTDLGGHHRIAANVVTCKGPGSPIVDMGAFEARFKTKPSCSAKVQIKSRKLSTKHDKVKVTLACPTGYLYCDGTVKLSKGLGRAHFHIADGKRSKVTIRLSKKVLRKLRDRASLRVTLTVTDHDGLHHSAKSQRKLKLKL